MKVIDGVYGDSSGGLLVLIVRSTLHVKANCNHEEDKKDGSYEKGESDGISSSNHVDVI